MANANLKPRRKQPVQCQTMMAVRIEQASDLGNPSKHGTSQKAAFPWMLLADEFLISLGFKPGDRVSFSVNYANRCLTICPDYNYMIAGQPMTEEQIARREAAWTPQFNA